MNSNSFPWDLLTEQFGPPQNPSWRTSNPDEERVITLRQYQRQGALIRPSARRRKLYIQPIGEFTPGMASATDLSKEALHAFFQLETEVLPAKPATCVSEGHWRHSPFTGENWMQANAEHILDEILFPQLPRDALIVTALVPFDLWPGDNYYFVFGMASLQARVAVSSLCRMGDFDGTIESRRQALLHTIKVVTHEVAHSFTLDHCVEFSCCLNGSNDYAEGEVQPVELCPSCLRKLSWNIGFDPLRHLFDMQRLCSRWGFQPESMRFEGLIAAAMNSTVEAKGPSFFISAHGDHNFINTQVMDRDGFVYGTLDNFVGVKAVMDAFFEGALNGTRIEITYGEESGMAGAMEVAEHVRPDDLVIVVDVTGYVTECDLVIEKCSDQWMSNLIQEALKDSDFSYQILSDCGIQFARSTRRTSTNNEPNVASYWRSPVTEETIIATR